MADLTLEQIEHLDWLEREASKYISFKMFWKPKSTMPLLLSSYSPGSGERAGADIKFIRSSRNALPSLLSMARECLRMRDLESRLAAAQADRIALVAQREDARDKMDESDIRCDDLEKAIAAAQAERDAALRELERWRHGTPVEGDYVCLFGMFDEPDRARVTSDALAKHGIDDLAEALQRTRADTGADCGAHAMDPADEILVALWTAHATQVGCDLPLLRQVWDVALASAEYRCGTMAEGYAAVGNDIAELAAVECVMEIRRMRTQP